jgi:putative endonuclease
MDARRRRGRAAYASGLAAEEAVCAALAADGWTVLARRLRTGAGEVDVVAAKAGVLSLIEVKSRRTLADAALALTLHQRERLARAGEIILGMYPEEGRLGVRFDVVVVDPAGRVRRVADAFRPG